MKKRKSAYDKEYRLPWPGGTKKVPLRPRHFRLGDDAASLRRCPARHAARRTAGEGAAGLCTGAAALILSDKTRERQHRTIYSGCFRRRITPKFFCDIFPNTRPSIRVGRCFWVFVSQKVFRRALPPGIMRECRKKRGEASCHFIPTITNA